METQRETIALGAGCFWGAEDAFRRLPGALEVTSGYAGGHSVKPTYEEVCSGGTGHAEVVKVTYDPARLPLTHLLEVFFEIHDPTQGNRQGNDIGSQYRSIILTTTPEQGDQVQKAVRLKDRLGEYGRPLTTQIEDLDVFYPAEEYHQRYLEKHPHGYCHIPRSYLRELGPRQA